MSKVKITKKQAEFIEGFKKSHYWDNEEEVAVREILPTWARKALHNLLQFGFGKGLEDANGKNLSDDFNDLEGNFGHDQVPLLIEAVMHGYEVKEKNIVLYIYFIDKEYNTNRKLYYGRRFNSTDKDIASKYNLTIECEKEQVEELKAQGWEVEEVK